MTNSKNNEDLSRRRATSLPPRLSLTPDEEKWSWVDFAATAGHLAGFVPAQNITHGASAIGSAADESSIQHQHPPDHGFWPNDDDTVSDNEDAGLQEINLTKPRRDDDEALLDDDNNPNRMQLQGRTLSGLWGGKSQAAKVRKCWVDVRNPRIGECPNENNIVRVRDRYRKAISDFFGRNKTATASIPEEYYPVICRTCYQNMIYRMTKMDPENTSKNEAAKAEIHCDMIISTLEKMKGRIYLDPNGQEWPWWCGLEMQLTKAGYDLIHDFDNLSKKAEEKNRIVKEYRERVKEQGKRDGDKRLHGLHVPDDLPGWLLDVCMPKSDGQEDTVLVGDRGCERYSFEELIHIIKSVKTYCHQNECTFPTIEAIPVTIGMLDSEIVVVKLRLRKEANRVRDRLNAEAKTLERDAADRPQNKLAKERAIAKRQEADNATRMAKAADEVVVKAREDAKLSEGTVPCKRKKSPSTMKNHSVQEESDGDAGDIGDGIDDDHDVSGHNINMETTPAPRIPKVTLLRKLAMTAKAKPKHASHIIDRKRKSEPIKLLHATTAAELRANIRRQATKRSNTKWASSTRGQKHSSRDTDASDETTPSESDGSGSSSPPHKRPQMEPAGKTLSSESGESSLSPRTKRQRTDKTSTTTSTGNSLRITLRCQPGDVEVGLNKTLELEHKAAIETGTSIGTPSKTTRHGSSAKQGRKANVAVYAKEHAAMMDLDG